MTFARAASRLTATVLGLVLGPFGGALPAHAADPADPADALVRAAEQALTNGDTATAQTGFERAAAMRHAADIEMGLVRTAMQAGAYREALAFCAHTAGDHLDEPAGSALYAWLLRIGGQDALAQRVLSDTLARAPTDAVVLAARSAFDAAFLAAPSGVLLDLPQRVAPQPQMLGGQAALLPGTRAVAAGVLLDGGGYALVPLTALLTTPPGVGAAPRLWLRNGLGQTTEAVATVATVDTAAAQAPFAALGLTLLRLRTALPQPALLSSQAASRLAPRDPFAGSAGYAFAYPAGAAALAWPTLHAGFLGGAAPQDGSRRLGFEMPAGPLGGPVFDAAGRLAGIAVGTAAQASMLPVSMWREPVAQALAAALASPAATPAAPQAELSPAAPPRMPTDEVYERGLKLALQVLVWP